MEMQPGYGCDLDAQVAAAISDGDPNRALDDPDHDNDASLLVTACINGRHDLAERLFAAGASMTSDELSRVLLWSHGRHGLAFLLDRGVAWNERCMEVAVRHGSWATAFALLDRGGDLRMRLQPGSVTLLHIAAWNGDRGALADLLRRGAEVDARDNQGLTPLMKVCDLERSYHPPRPEIAALLLEHGADPNATTPEGETPLVLCICWPGRTSMERTRLVETLLRHGANPDTPSPRGATPLMLAAHEDDRSLARALLQAGARPDLTTPDGRTALDVARSRGSRRVEAVLR